MTEAEQKRVRWHMDVPVCRLRSGIKRHIALIGMDDLSLLCRAMNCSASEVARAMFETKRKKQPGAIDGCCLWEAELLWR